MGIGTLSERSLHATLKRYIEPDLSFHEVPCGKYIADILRDHEITEVQTGSFYRLREKLSAFLPDYKVTIVYPISAHRRIIWIDPTTGAYTEPRRSPKTGTPQELFNELTSVKDFLIHPNLQIRVLMVDVDEYRVLDGWDASRKKGAHRAERIPTNIVSDIRLKEPSDWLQLLPDALPNPFTAKAFEKLSRISPICTSRALRCLEILGVIRRNGKQGKAYLYERAI